MSKELLEKAQEEIRIFERPSVDTSKALMRRVEELEDAIKYATDYLDKPLNQIGYDSKAHRELLDAINQ
jgi:precorrin-6x reductase